jgi:hypothetical protein
MWGDSQSGQLLQAGAVVGTDPVEALVRKVHAGEEVSAEEEKELKKRKLTVQV